MSLPAFIFNQLQNELEKIQLELLEKISSTYDIPIEELTEQFLSPLKVIPESNEKVFISKKYKGRKIPCPHDRCQAVTWNRGKGGQCSRSKCEGEEFCKHHAEHLPFGKINDVPLEKQFNQPIRAIYK